MSTKGNIRFDQWIVDGVKRHYFFGFRNDLPVIELFQGKARWWVVTDDGIAPFDQASEAAAYAHSAANWC